MHNSFIKIFTAGKLIDQLLITLDVVKSSADNGGVALIEYYCTLQEWGKEVSAVDVVHLMNKWKFGPQCLDNVIREIYY